MTWQCKERDKSALDRYFFTVDQIKKYNLLTITISMTCSQRAFLSLVWFLLKYITVILVPTLLKHEHNNLMYNIILLFE